MRLASLRDERQKAAVRLTVQWGNLAPAIVSISACLALSPLKHRFPKNS